MASIIKRINADGFDIEVYSDGDCILHSPEHGYFLLSAEVLSQIPRKPQKETKGNTQQPIRADNAHLAPPSKTKPAADDDTSIKRRIKPLEGGGWECFLVFPDKPELRQVYTKRSQARSASAETEVGSDGRIA